MGLRFRKQEPDYFVGFCVLLVFALSLHLSDFISILLIWKTLSG